MVKYLLSGILACLAISGCKDNGNSPGSPPSNNEPPSSAITLTPELAQEIKGKPINEQLTILYQNFEPQLDREESLSGIDENQDGIRDDIEAFIHILDVNDTIRKGLKQYAKSDQLINLTDFSTENKTEEAIDLIEDRAFEIADIYDKATACLEHLKIPNDERQKTEEILHALTFNTKQRVLQYFNYNHQLDGGAFILKMGDYCEK